MVWTFAKPTASWAFVLTIPQRIEHAGYQREVISQNPKRYDENGDELDDEEEDEDADAAAAEANPYSGVILHGMNRTPLDVKHD